MKCRSLLPLARLPATSLHAAVVTAFDEASLPAAVMLDVPNAAQGNAAFDTVNDELDFNASEHTD